MSVLLALALVAIVGAVYLYEKSLRSLEKYLGVPPTLQHWQQKSIAGQIRDVYNPAMAPVYYPTHSPKLSS